MKCSSYETFFEVIANKSRIRIIEELMKKPMCVNEICSAIKEEQSKVSHNLKKMAECNFINFKKQGKLRIYTLNTETIAPLMILVEKHVKKYCCNSCKKGVLK